MGGLAIATFVLLSFVIRSVLAERRSNREVPTGAPPVARSEARDQGWAHHPRARRLGRPRTGGAGTFDDLIAARRFVEASRLATPTDHLLRARLAVMREGPVIDLVLAARMEPADRRGVTAKTRDEARKVLVRKYPGTPWGYSAKRTRPHAVPAAEREAIALIAKGRLSTPLAMYERLLRAFPRADQAEVWHSQSALLAALLNRHGVARRHALALVEIGRTPRMQQRGSRIAQTVGMQGRTVRARGSRRLHARAQKAVLASGRDWPATPHALVKALGERRCASERLLDATVLAASLKSGAHVWVGHMRHDGTGGAVAVRSFAPTERVVLLSDGTIEEWGEFVRSSVWGDRMIVFHSKRVTIEGDAPARAFRDIPAPADDEGHLSVDPDAMVLMRGASAATGDDEDSLASFVLALALERALDVGAYDIRAEAFHTHLAVTSARFPSFTWPLAMLAANSAGSVPESSRDLFAVGIEHWMGATFESHEARAAAFPDEAWFHLREANVAGLAVPPLVESMVDAARRRDGADVDAHLELLQHVLGMQHSDVVWCRALREITWRGARGALEAIAPRDAQHFENQIGYALACQSGEPSAPERAVNFDARLRSSADGRFVMLTSALHHGDLDAILEAVAASGQMGEFDDRSVWALNMALPVFADADTALGDCVEFLKGRSRSTLGTWLMADRPQWGLELLRSSAQTGSNRVAATLDLAVALVEQASRADQRDRDALAHEALLALDEIRGAAHSYSLWDYARIAATRLINPESALAELRALETIRRPLEAFVLCAAAASDAGLGDLASAMRARATNPALLNASIRSAARLGVSSEIETALLSADRGLVASALWAYYGIGGHIEPPPVPAAGGVVQIGSGAMWRLAEERHFGVLKAALAYVYPPSEQLAVRDGAPRVALSDLCEGEGADLRTVRALLATSSHPAYLRAAELALRWGANCGLDHTELSRRAPGLGVGAISA